MTTTLLVIYLLAAFLPAIAWVVFYQTKLSPRKMPLLIMTKAFLFGALAVIPAVIIEKILGLFIPRQLWAGNVLVMILAVGLVEELAKFFAFRFAIGKEKFDILDGVAYAVIAALGFAAAENLLYITTFSKINPIFALGFLAPVRAVICNLGHAFYTSIIGYFTGKAQMIPQKRFIYIPLGIALAAVLHGVYNTYVAWIIVPFTLMVIVGFLLYRFLIKKS